MVRATQLLDSDWLFYLGDFSNGQSDQVDDDYWRTVNIPHDWSIEGQFLPHREENWSWNGELDQRIGYLPQGIGWYRKRLFIPLESQGKKIHIQFDGVFRNSEVWINGQYLGKRPYGYSSFCYDLTPHVKFGQSNLIAVRADNSGIGSRWYTGSGIYRKVTVIMMENIHVGQWGTYWTTPEVTKEKVELQIRTQIVNETDQPSVPIELISEVWMKDQKVVGTKSSVKLESKETEVTQALTISNPKLWHPTTPNMYQIKTTILRHEELIDEYWTPLGLRSCRFDPDKGFFINETSLKIKGVCLHHDNGCLGAKEHTRSLERKLKILQDMGCNAIRTSHNPPSIELLELCDQMGFLVMNEIFDEWLIPKNPKGYSSYFNEWFDRDVSDYVRRDRNHPSVIIWSCGNEVEEQISKNGVAILKKLLNIFHQLDPTRPVTQGCSLMRGANKSGFSGLLDLAGYNYDGDRILGNASPKLFGTNFKCNYDLDHIEFPKRCMIGTENCSSYNTRGVYHFPAEILPSQQQHEDYHCSAYDVISETPLLIMKTRPYVSGMFTWEGFDYIGEPTPYPWPARSSQYGIVDLAGFPKETYYLYKSQWSDSPMVHIVPQNWNWHEGMTISVWLYSNCDSVELFLNGVSLGERSFAEEDFEDLLHLDFQVPYIPGELKAVAKTKGKILATDRIVTTKSPYQLKIHADRLKVAIPRDLIFLTVSVCDIDGNVVPDSQNLVNFTVKGPGKIIGTDNGNPISHEIFTDNQRHIFNGYCLGVLENSGEPGEIEVKVTSAMLKSTTIIINKK